MSDNQREAGTIILDPTHASFAPEETVHDLGATHFIGIGGAGMSVLAEMLHEQGVEVDGSDREPSAKTDRLQSLGITVEFGQQAKNVEGKNTVVFSSAIKPDNPEIVAAHEAGERIVHRSDILALLMNAKRAVTVAGAHGKTTTSSMLAHILVNAGEGELADPSYAIGGSIQGKDGAIPARATCWWPRPTNRTAASPNTIRKSPSSPIPKPTTLTTTARRTIIGPHSWTMPDTPPKP